MNVSYVPMGYNTKTATDRLNWVEWNINFKLVQVLRIPFLFQLKNAWMIRIYYVHYPNCM